MQEARFTDEWSLVGFSASSGTRLFGCLNPAGERCFWVDSRGEGPEYGGAVPPRIATGGPVPKGFELYPESADANPWRILDQNETSVQWQRSDTGRTCMQRIAHSRQPGIDERGYDGVQTMGKRGYLTTEGLACDGYIPREAAPVLRAIDPATSAPDSFKAKAHRFNDEQIAAMTQALPGNEAARLLNVAALRAELDVGSEARWRRMTGPCHPVTGRPLGK